MKMKNNNNNKNINWFVISIVIIVYSLVFTSIFILGHKTKETRFEYLNRNNEIHIYKQDSIIIYKFEELKD